MHSFLGTAAINQNMEKNKSLARIHSNPSSLLGKAARVTARKPWKILTINVILVIIISVIAIEIGDFKVQVDNKGWRSRGTLVADREMQVDIMNQNLEKLFQDTDGSVWNRLKTELQMGYVDLEERDENYERKRKLLGFDLTNKVQQDFTQLANFRGSVQGVQGREYRFLENQGECDMQWYSDTEAIQSEENLYALWQIQSDSMSILDADAIKQICEAEVNTLQVLKDANLCEKCSDGTCMQPLSLVLVLRARFDLHEASCDDLIAAYTTAEQEAFTEELVTCTDDYKRLFDSESKTPGNVTTCPYGYMPNLVDYSFGVGSNRLSYSSSYFRTENFEDEDLYRVYLDFDGTNGNIVEGVYDTTSEAFNTIYVDQLVVSDMMLAVASLTVTFLAMMIHTRSPWLTLFGVLQIIFAIPMAYFIYVFIARLNFFPFLNFIGVFVSAALGADDLFVAVDKFKNARIQNPDASTEDVAEIALPDAAGAMALTTSTTAVAFFATCICPVPPILCFAVYCGLMIVFNYVLNILFVFPALCLYDIWLQGGSRSCLISIGRKEGTATDSVDELDVEDPEKPTKLSLIHRILKVYYSLLHRFNWYVFVACIAAVAACCYAAFSLSLPDTTEVRLLPEDHPLENHFLWSSLLLSASLFSSGTSVSIVYGLKAGDTGRQNDPDTLSKFLLDETFDPRNQDSQVYLRDFCGRLFQQVFFEKSYAEYECAINIFESWLANESSSNNASEEYANNCNGASELPMPEEDFDPCIIAWSKLTENREVLQENGKVRIMTIDGLSSISFRSPIPEINDEWNRFEDFFEEESKNAPEGVNKSFHVSPMWWWFDTNTQMLNTAFGAAGIAVGFSAIVVFFSSRSFQLTIFSAGCILYVLTAATASLVGLGWELGFLESVCFAILVGISCDFVIHFGHAYNHRKGNVPRGIRTEYAVIHMGPSILAAALTTFAAAIVMLFCRVVFFTKFAMILLMTILHATVGSFVVYLVLSDLFGPAEPTKFVDNIIACERKENEESEESDDSSGFKKELSNPDEGVIDLGKQ